MLARLLAIWDHVRTSLWAVPLVTAAVCASLAVFLLNVDLPWTTEIAWLYAGGAEQAPEFASSLVSAMINVTALAFSITMVVLTLAAQQLGPRLISIFMSDRAVQIVLGLFLGTVIYLLLLLRLLDGEETPSLAITGGTILVLVSMIALLFFVHNLASSIVSDHVVARAGEEFDSHVLETFPEQGQQTRQAPQGGKPLRCEPEGYVQRINYHLLVKTARRHDAVIVLAYRPGAHVLAGEAHAWISGEASSEDLLSALRRSVVISGRRTPGQDPEYSARQLVEVGLRALSTGINDEFTALAVIDRLTRTLSRLTQRADAPTSWDDEDGVARVFGPAPSFTSLLDAAFDQIRDAGAGKHRILLCLAGNLRKLAAMAQPRQSAAVVAHIEKLEFTAKRSLESEPERASVLALIEQARARVKEGTSSSQVGDRALT